MRNVLYVNGQIFPLCAEFAYTGVCANGENCAFSHADKDERFCLTHFEYEDGLVYRDCGFGGNSCLFGHSPAARVTYLEWVAEEARRATAGGDDGDAVAEQAPANGAAPMAGGVFTNAPSAASAQTAPLLEPVHDTSAADGA